MTKITKRSVDAAAPGDKEFFIWDDELKGFGLRVYPSGRKMYLAQFRANGRVRRINIGLHGIVTPEAARTKAMKHLSDVSLGGDPAGERDRNKASPTMKEFGQRFLEEHVATQCKPTTQAEYKRSVELFINPKLGSHRLIDVTPILRGWINYFRLAQVKRLFEDLDGWLRRKLRCILWRQWKRPRTRMKKLMGRGLDELRAWRSANNDRGPWWNAGALHMRDAYRNSFFENLGLISVLDQHRRLNHAA